MIKRTIYLLIAGAKALTFAGAILLSGSTAVADDDCYVCAPPPDCYPDEPCWGEC